MKAILAKKRKAGEAKKTEIRTVTPKASKQTHNTVKTTRTAPVKNRVVPIVAATTAVAAATVVASNTETSTPSSEGAELYIAVLETEQEVELADSQGIGITNPIKIVFGLTGMGVAPAGVDAENTGHHHLLIDADELPAEGEPMGDDVFHFDAGETEALLELQPGEHTLQLILGDKNHIPHSPIVSSEKITVTVVETPSQE